MREGRGRATKGSNPTPKLGTRFENWKFEDKFSKEGENDGHPLIRTPINKPFKKSISQSREERPGTVSTTGWPWRMSTASGEGHILPGFYPFDLLTL